MTMQNITLLKSSEIRIDNNDYGEAVQFVKRRAVTQAEIDANNIGALKLSGSDFVIDQTVIDADLQKQLDKIYADKLSEIKTARNTALINGKFISASVAGFEIDCRSDGITNDVLNVSALIDGMTATSATTVVYKGTTAEQTLTLAQLQALYIEMIQYGMAIYDNKIKKDKAINLIYNDSVKTVQQKMAEIQAVIW